MELRSAMLAAAGVLALTACADNSPTAVVPHRPALDVAAASDAPTDRHIVLLKSSGKVSADFARSIAAQGGGSRRRSRQSASRSSPA
jgi:hypothetical protein